MSHRCSVSSLISEQNKTMPCNVQNSLEVEEALVWEKLMIYSRILESEDCKFRLIDTSPIYIVYLFIYLIKKILIHFIHWCNMKYLCRAFHPPRGYWCLRPTRKKFSLVKILQWPPAFSSDSGADISRERRLAGKGESSSWRGTEGSPALLWALLTAAVSVLCDQIK